MQHPQQDEQSHPQELLPFFFLTTAAIITPITIAAAAIPITHSINFYSIFALNFLLRKYIQVSTPASAAAYARAPVQGDDHLFVLAGGANIFAEDRVMLPLLSHA